MRNGDAVRSGPKPLLRLPSLARLELCLQIFQLRAKKGQRSLGARADLRRKLCQVAHRIADFAFDLRDLLLDGVTLIRRACLDGEEGVAGAIGATDGMGVGALLTGASPPMMQISPLGSTAAARPQVGAGKGCALVVQVSVLTLKTSIEFSIVGVPPPMA